MSDVKAGLKPGPIDFVCCNDKKAAHICVCILCESLFHISCSERRKFISFGGILGFCQCRKELTSIPENVRTADETKNSIILSLKEKLIKSQDKCLSLQDDLQDKSNQLKKMQEYAVSKMEIDRLKIENNLLNKLVEETSEKNKLLREKNEEFEKKIKAINENVNNVTYANITNGTVKAQIPVPKQTSSVIIKPKSNTNLDEVKREIQQSIKPEDLKAKVITTKQKRDGTLKIICKTADDSNKLMKELDIKCKDKFESHIEKLNNPKIKIVGITQKYSIPELQTIITNHNFSEYPNNKFTVTHIQEHITNGKNTNKQARSEIHYTAYAELDPLLFYYTMKSKKLHVGWEMCRVYEDLDMRRCYNCCGFGHTAGKCQNATICLHCAGNHESKDCKSKSEVKCINCIQANDKYKCNRNTEHSAAEVSKCDSYKSRLEYLQSKIEYSFDLYTHST